MQRKDMAHGHFGGMQVACLLWQRVCSEKFPSRTSLSGGFGKEAFLCVPLLLGSKRAVSPKCGHEPKTSFFGHILALGHIKPTRYATRLCNQDGSWVNRRDTGKRDQNCVFLTREILILRTFPRKKTQKKYDTPFSSCPNCPNLCSLHALVARRSGRCGACVQPIGPPESH